jgi:hypothetical protein
MIITERTEMLKRALTYHEFKLNELLNSEKEEENNPVNSLLREDIYINKDKIGTPFILISTDTSDSQQILKQHRDVTCCALINYIAALENSKKKVIDELAGANLSFDNIDKEINLAKRAKTELCK